jgi:uncharacterized membrane protein YhaH (DUF805 family)
LANAYSEDCPRAAAFKARPFRSREEFLMSLGTILIIVLILLLIGAIPSWPHSSGWGYGPSGILGTVLVIVLILILLGRI